MPFSIIIKMQSVFRLNTNLVRKITYSLILDGLFFFFKMAAAKLGLRD